MRHAPALLLLAALLGGIGASSVHRAAHAVEWAEAQGTHAADHHGDEGDRAQAPCADNDAHALDCAVCSNLTVAAFDRATAADHLAMDARHVEAREALVDVRRVALPARGPPAVA